MSCVPDLLASIAPELEVNVQHRLRGPFGPLLAAYLPQTWVFTTEDGTATLRVERDGRTHASPGAAEGADVTVHTSHVRLVAALRTRQREHVPPGPLAVTAHTAKGQTAFSFLRSRLGL